MKTGRTWGWAETDKCQIVFCWIWSELKCEWAWCQSIR